MSAFTLQTKVADALAARPELRELLPAFHPAFEKLNHPVLGKIMPRLVTIEQAARVAGVDAQAMLDVCNLPGPPTGPAPAAARRMDPPPPWSATTPVHELDARPIIAGGQDPFAAIMRALRQAPQGSVFRVRAPFEPAPLIALLGKRGWVPHVTWEGEDCLASFWRPPAAGGEEGEDGDGDVEALLAERLAGDTLDVRGLEPPWPLQLVLHATERVLPLTVLHQREPALLYPRLVERGLEWTVTQEGGLYTIRIQPGAP